MTTENITIVVNERGSRVVKRNLEEIGTASTKTKNALEQMQSALKNLALAFGIRELVRLIDTYTNLQNRLRLVTKSTAELATVTNELFSIANQTRSSYQSTTETYTRTALAVKELGLSQQETLNFTKSLNQAVILSGASAIEAENALIQLSQGLASGALRGDELRSVMEQLPAVADIISKSLGITRGELRELGSEGKITGEIVVEAFRKASDDLNRKFGTTVPTISQSLIVLKNNVVQLIGSFDKTAGISANVAKGILFISENIGTIVKVLLVAGAAWASYRALMLAAIGAAILSTLASNVVAFLQLAKTVRNLAGAVALLNATFLIGPGALIAVLALCGIAVYTFRDDIKATIIVVISESIILIDRLTVKLKDFADKAKSIPDALGALYAQGAVKLGIIDQDSLDGVLADKSDAKLKPNSNLSGFTQEQLRGAADDLILNNNSPVLDDPVNLGIKSPKTAKTPLSEEALKVIERQKKLLEDILAPQVNYNNSVNDLNVLYDRGLITLQQYSEQMQKATELLIPEEMLEVATRQKELLEGILEPQLTYNNSVNDLNFLYEKGLITLGQFQSKLKEVQDNFLSKAVPTNFIDGFIVQLQRMMLETSKATIQMGSQFASIFGPGGTLIQGIADAAGRAIAFGDSFQESIRQVAQGIISQLISSLVQVGLNMLLNAALGKTLIASSTAASVAAGAATAAAWAPAAAFVSLASFGANSGPASIGLASTFAVSKSLQAASSLGGFEEGGYTGNGGTKQIAGVVHGQEYVVNASATSRNRGVLEAMNRGEDYKAGKNTNVYIINEIPNAEFETKQISEYEVEIIARKVVQEDAASVIARDMGDPNSRTSKALSKNANVSRRRQ